LVGGVGPQTRQLCNIFAPAGAQKMAKKKAAARQCSCSGIMTYGAATSGIRRRRGGQNKGGRREGRRGRCNTTTHCRIGMCATPGIRAVRLCRQRAVSGVAITAGLCARCYRRQRSAYLYARLILSPPALYIPYTLWPAGESLMQGAWRYGGQTRGLSRLLSALSCARALFHIFIFGVTTGKTPLRCKTSVRLPMTRWAAVADGSGLLAA